MRRPRGALAGVDGFGATFYIFRPGAILMLGAKNSKNVKGGN
jgi:hypothetical protein